MWMTWTSSCAAVVFCVFACSPAALASGGKLYKYQDENGRWVYTDRRPSAGESFEEQELSATFEAPGVEVLRRDDDDGTVLIARNGYFGPVHLAFQLSDHANIGAQTPLSGNLIIPARSDMELLTVTAGNPAEAVTFRYDFRYLPGDPGARHQPARPYRLPYALAKSFPVSQAPPDAITHNDPSSRHAIDFVMPVGTAVYAAREGRVLDVASHFFKSGTDMDMDGPRANVVRVLHADGTMAVYAHLNWNSIRVVPGQEISRGEYLADSGNTGFSTGPHLHFVVQRNRGGQLVSVPLKFEGPNGVAIAVRTGDRPVAY